MMSFGNEERVAVGATSETAEVIPRPDLFIRVAEDRLSVIVDFAAPSAESIDLFVKRIQRELVTLGVTSIPGAADAEAWVRKVVAESHETGYVTDAVLLSGQPPTEPINGQIIWMGSFFEAGFVVDDATGAINYRQHAAQRSVAEGQKLAEVIPPVEGKDGVDVFGRRVRVKKALPARLVASDNVRRVEATPEEPMSFYALCAGRIRLTKNGLAVDPILKIQGSVGLETGDIKHPGAMEIMKDIEAASSVEAQGDIEVYGYIEAATIDTKGCLTARGGIGGGGEGKKITVGGAVHAKFILDADIEAGGDIVVEREIVQSTIKTRGSLTILNGRIIGGEITAMQGIIVGQTGSPAGVYTVLTTGVDFYLEREIAGMQKEITALEESRAKIQTGLRQMLSMIDTLSVNQKDAIRQLLAKDNELKEKAEAIHSEILEMREAAKERAKLIVEIRRVAHSETLICLGKERLRIHGEYSGPARARIHNGQIELRPLQKGEK